MTNPGKEAPDCCEVCGREPMNRQTRKLKWIETTQEWTCDVCLGKNELPPKDIWAEAKE